MTLVVDVPAQEAEVAVVEAAEGVAVLFEAVTPPLFHHLDELRVSGLLDRALDARMAEFSTTLNGLREQATKLGG